MQEFVERIRRVVARHSGLAPEDVKIESPRDAVNGDLAFPCFQLAKAQRQPPPAAAVKLAQAIAGELPGIAVVAAGPYLNFRIERKALAQSVLGAISRGGARYGGSEEGAGKTIVLDYSSPNIGKPMHVGHIRSTIIGAALHRIFGFLGYRSVGINHLGDFGSQFGGLIVARELRTDVDLEHDPVHGLLTLYQWSNEQIATNPDFATNASISNAVVSGVLPVSKAPPARQHDRETQDWIREVSLQGFRRTYARLGIKHDLTRGESFYEEFLEPTIKRIQETRIAEVSDGALIVDLSSVDKGLAKTPCILRQSDGRTLYATRDLAALFHRWEEFRFARALYVVGSEQKLHFRQLKAVLKRMGCEWEASVEHVDFGLLLGPGRVKLASRKGEVLVLDDLLDEVVAEARAIIEEKNPELAGKDRVAEQVGIGALVFNDLKRERNKDVVFDKAEILAFEGETGPYVQYTHARLASILRKADEAGGEGAAPDWALLEDAAPILLALGRFPTVVATAAEECEPSHLAQYLLALCRTISSWLVDHRVLAEEAPLRAARLFLVRGAEVVLRNGLTLLGVGAPDEM
jgi:arginyl-tRNA synthetase